MENHTHLNKEILRIVEACVDGNPHLRFTQILANLGINTFANQRNPASEKFQLRDNYNDRNKDVLYRIKSQPDLDQ